MTRLIAYRCFATLLCNLALISCNTHTEKAVVQAIKMVRQTNVYNGKNPVESGTWSVRYYYQRLIMYQYPYTYDSMVNGKVIKREERNAYFIYHSDSLFGYHYDFNIPAVMPYNVRMPVDSIRLKYNDLNYDSILAVQGDSSYKDKYLNEVYHHSGDKWTPPYTLTISYSKGFKMSAKPIPKSSTVREI
jgi:hypothetical protein